MITIKHIKSVLTNHFPGDTFRRIDVMLSNGCTVTAFGVWPRKDKQGSYYETDTLVSTFNTMAEVKESARRKIQAEIDAGIYG